MRIAFDLDGVLADLHGPFVQTAVRLFPELDVAAIKSADIGASPPEEEEEPATAESPQLPADIVLDRRQTDAVWQVLTNVPDFWAHLQEIESGAIARLARIADERRWEVLFITSRPKSAGTTVQRQSQYWLQRMGFPLPSVYVVHGSRGRVADALNLDVVVDDRPDNCLDVVLESKAGAVLIFRGDQSKVPASAKRLGIAVAPTVEACLDTLVEADQQKEGGGLLDRLRRLFGLRTRSASPLHR